MILLIDDVVENGMTFVQKNTTFQRRHKRPMTVPNVQNPIQKKPQKCENLIKIIFLSKKLNMLRIGESSTLTRNYKATFIMYFELKLMKLKRSEL